MCFYFIRKLVEIHKIMNRLGSIPYWNVLFIGMRMCMRVNYIVSVCLSTKKVVQVWGLHKKELQVLHIEYLHLIKIQHRTILNNHIVDLSMWYYCFVYYVVLHEVIIHIWIYLYIFITRNGILGRVYINTPCWWNSCTHTHIHYIRTWTNACVRTHLHIIVLPFYFNILQ